MRCVCDGVVASVDHVSVRGGRSDDMMTMSTAYLQGMPCRYMCTRNAALHRRAGRCHHSSSSSSSSTSSNQHAHSCITFPEKTAPCQYARTQAAGSCPSYHMCMTYPHRHACIGMLCGNMHGTTCACGAGDAYECMLVADHMTGFANHPVWMKHCHAYVILFGQAARMLHADAQSLGQHMHMHAAHCMLMCTDLRDVDTCTACHTPAHTSHPPISISLLLSCMYTSLHHTHPRTTCIHRHRHKRISTHHNTACGTAITSYTSTSDRRGRGTCAGEHAYVIAHPCTCARHVRAMLRVMSRHVMSCHVLLMC